MKAQELIVNYTFANGGKTIQELIFSSFSNFFKQEVKKVASLSDYHV